MARAVTVIPPTIQPITHLARNAVVRRRVAAYARVSTSSEEQLTSYEAQVDYYTRFIQSKPEWEFVRVYTDEGISAVNTKKREGFNQMVRDALDGKIDLIVTKSVSRFARNTVDSLVTVRKLKEKGVEVYFEKENIYTLDSKGELLITIMSSLAQEEMLRSWELAKMDGFLEPFIEHHGLLRGLVEACIRNRDPEAYQRITKGVISFSRGWMALHNPENRRKVTGELSTMEFSIAMLASGGWSNKEIGEHLGISINTVKHYLTDIFCKLNVKKRDELKKFMLK